MSTANLICHLDINPTLKEKLLSEILPVVEAAKDDIVEKLEYETVMDLEYLHQCFYESLRIDVPTPLSSIQCFSEDVTFFNGFKLTKGDAFYICVEAMHHDPKQWQQPEKFVPERFDSKSPWFKKPNGDPRHSLTFNPFLGGKRGCIGKTFAEVVVRYTVPILYYHFDFEMLDLD